MSRRNSAICLTIIISLFFSCKKKDDTRRIDPELLKLFSFEKGTYWIYEDTATGSLDTFRVIDRSTSITTTEPPFAPASTERHTVSITCKTNALYSYNIQIEGKNILVLFDKLIMGFGVGFPDSSLLTFIYYKNLKFDSVAVSSYDQDNVICAKSKLGLVKMHFRHKYDTISRTWILRYWNIVQ